MSTTGPEQVSSVCAKKTFSYMTHVREKKTFLRSIWFVVAEICWKTLVTLCLSEGSFGRRREAGKATRSVKKYNIGYDFHERTF